MTRISTPIPRRAASQRSALNPRLKSASHPRGKASGFTIIEILVTLFIISTVITGVFGLFILGLRGAQTTEARVAAIALANERMEMIRNLPYVDVGTNGGNPSGAIEPNEVINRNGIDYNVLTDIRYVDDAYDGQATGSTEEEEKITICHKPGTPDEKTLVVGAPSLDAHLAHGDTQGPCAGDDPPTPPGDEFNADYKQVLVEVTWNNQYDISPILLMTYVSPPGVEGSQLGGTLDFQALNTNGEGVADVTLTIVNTAVNPPFSLIRETNVEGRVVEPALPESAQAYELSATKPGYTTDATYDQTPTFIPHPDYSHLTMITREVTRKTFLMDLISTLNITTQNEIASPLPNIAYTLQSRKAIGTDDQNATVYKVSEAAQTDAAGTNTHANLEWGLYDISIDGETVGYDLKESSLVFPFTVNPNSTADLTLTLTPYTPISLHVTVVDPTGVPIPDADVQLSGNGFDDTLATGPFGQNYFGDLPTDEVDYTLTVDAAGFAQIVTTIKAEGTTHRTIELTQT